MRSWRSILGFTFGFCTTAVVGACTPPAATGNCTVDEDCQGRGQYCEPVTNVCKDGEADYTKTDDDSPSDTFADKPIPFFRGQVCTVPGLAGKAGSAIPMTFRPCLHPCMTGGTNYFQHSWGCLSGICSGMSLFYTIGSGAGCPAEAWGQFSKDLCVYDVQQSSALGPVELDGTPVEGTLKLEIPFLTNSDLSEVVAYKGLSLGQQEGDASALCTEECDGKSGEQKGTCLVNCRIEELAYQYLQQDDRVLEFDLRGENPTPPENCWDEAMGTLNPECECFEIGFG
jgi:hypothetical protein